MSSPTFTPSRWRPDRLRLACDARGLDAAGLRRLINERRFTANPSATPLDQKSAKAWLTERADPTRSKPGYPPAIFEIVDTLGVSLDWLMDRTDTARGLPREWQERARQMDRKVRR